MIGGGPAGLQAALDLAQGGAQVILVDDQPELGGHLRYRKQAGVVPHPVIARLQAMPNVEIISQAYCFGLYEGNLLGVLQANPHPGAIERLIHLRAKKVVIATGAYEVPFTFENNDLPGIMLSTAVQRLIHLARNQTRQPRGDRRRQSGRRNRRRSAGGRSQSGGHSGAGSDSLGFRLIARQRHSGERRRFSLRPGGDLRPAGAGRWSSASGGREDCMERRARSIPAAGFAGERERGGRRNGRCASTPSGIRRCAPQALVRLLL